MFAIGAGLAGFAGVVGGSALSIAPGEDVRYLLASLVVVIVGGMGSITGAAIGALLIGLAEQIGLVYFPTYGIVLTFVIMVVDAGAAAAGHHGHGAQASADAPPSIGPSRRCSAVRVRHRPHSCWRARCFSLYPARRLRLLHLPDRRLFADLRA